MATALGAGLLIAGCGSSATSVGSGTTTPAPSSSPGGSGSPAPVAPTTLRCADGRVTVPVGRVLVVRGCGAGVSSRAVGTVLAAAGTDRFRAVRAGTASIELSAGPSCPAGTLCPQYRRFVGLISVTVRDASAG